MTKRPPWINSQSKLTSLAKSHWDKLHTSALDDYVLKTASEVPIEDQGQECELEPVHHEKKTVQVVSTKFY